MSNTIIRFVSNALFVVLAAAAPVRAELQAPPIEASAYILIDATSGDVLAEHNADQALSPASLTKMMTSYLIIDGLMNGQLGEQDQVPISENAWRNGGGGGARNSSMMAAVNSQVALIDLLRGVIIQSGNDASIALAEYMSGSESTFAQRMNEQATSLGMKNTHFVNATGLPAEGHRSTARDLALLGAAVARDHEKYYPIYAEKEFTWNNIRQLNRNLLLWRDASVDGIKTGHTEEAGYCLVASAKQGDMRLVSVVLGTKSEEARAVESQKLLAFGFRNFESQRLYAAAAVLQTARVWKGQAEQVNIGVEQAVALTLPRGSKDKLQAQVAVEKIIEAPITKGQVLGSLTVSLDGKTVLNQPVVALQEVAEGGLFTRFWDSIKLFFLKLLGGI